MLRANGPDGYRNRAVDLSAEIDEHRSVLRSVPVVEHTCIRVAIDGDLCGTELLEIFRTGHIAARQHHAIRIEHTAGAFIIDPVNAKFFL